MRICQILGFFLTVLAGLAGPLVALSVAVQNYAAWLSDHPVLEVLLYPLAAVPILLLLTLLVLDVLEALAPEEEELWPGSGRRF